MPHASVALAAALMLLAAPPPPRPADFVWFQEGETCTTHEWSNPVTTNPDYAGCYGGGMLVIAKSQDAPAGGWSARFIANVPQAGTYALWLAATPPGAGCPLAVKVDDQPAVPVGTAGEGSWGPGGCFRWLQAAHVGLTAGEHKIAVLATGRRAGDNLYYAYLDALGLQLIGDDPNPPLSAFPPNVEVGRMPIRSYSGNGSVGWFMQYWGTQQGGSAGEADDALIALLKRCGCSAYCDYQAWCRVEEQPGKWDWSFYQKNARKLREGGLGYVPFAWLHFPPKWAQEGKDFVPYRCLEHNQTLRQSSLWAPQTLATYEEYYRRLATDFHEEIAYLRLSTPSDYGEVGMPAAMTSWLVPQQHAHPGYWCGDDYALADFRRAARERCGSLAALNARWGTKFATWEEVHPPEVRDNQAAKEAAAGSPTAIHRWLDFVDWYQDSIIGFAARAARIVRHNFPNKEIIISLGYGQEPVPAGNDESRHIRRFSELGLSAQTPGDIGYFATRRVSTACRAYGVPYFTEPPGDVDRKREVQRLFMDASNGTQTWFDYPPNMDGARDLLAQYKQHLTGRAPVCDVAYLLPSSWWWLRPELGWPQATYALAEGLRDRLDYEVVDELLVRDGALEKLHTRVLILVEGDLLRHDTLLALEKWVKAGGVFLVIGDQTLKNLEGDTSVSQRLLPPVVAPDIEVKADPANLARTCWTEGRAVGNGRTLRGWGADADASRAVIPELTYRMSRLDPGRRNAALIDGEADGVWATLLPDRALYYNTSEGLIHKHVTLRPEDFPRGRPRPAKWEWDLTVPARGIAFIPLG